ncbi:alpha/beta fold hydrolase [Pedobacter duraquae]|uniref:Pimeloyl-ACP methyl ester carboxylesterase n=1 Tax=Pedobacter duraquae TaxID=425511 RepID=A0A4R6IDC9_9SPHI|nr:alpha/beta hydrolase [Pedobacter duraquae]TDO20280.1 pimeloyl-ACP methyl ester carboxylesterase [Pedobacter duraquae]
MKTTNSKLKISTLSAFFLLVLITFTGFAQQNPASKEGEKPTVILVHGAFADGSSWSKVIPILKNQGYQVIAVQNPLTSLNDDVATVERAISEVKGKVILVGHSWGGAVITQAGNNDKVKALVYVAAYAPSEGQSIDSISREAYVERKVPNVPGFTDPVITDGYIQLKEEAIVKYFAQDLPVQEAKNLAAVQGRFHVSTLTAKITIPAWKNKPSFFIIADNDQIISPQVEAEMAKKIHATTYHIPASHVVMLSKPAEVAKVIVKAAGIK